MLKTEERLARLTEKLDAKEKALAELGIKRKKMAQLEKQLKSEIAALKDEIRMADRDDLGEFLEQNGIPFDDVRAAVKNGVFDKPETKVDSDGNEPPEQDNIENVSPVTRNI